MSLCDYCSVLQQRRWGNTAGHTLESSQYWWTFSAELNGLCKDLFLLLTMLGPYFGTAEGKNKPEGATKKLTAGKHGFQNNDWWQSKKDKINCWRTGFIRPFKIECILKKLLHIFFLENALKKTYKWPYWVKPKVYFAWYPILSITISRFLGWEQETVHGTSSES